MAKTERKARILALFDETVRFEWEENELPDVCTKVENGFSFRVCGNIPVPKVEKGDRFLLPIDEGIAVDADGEYESGEFDCSRIGGRFSGREGTVQMVIIERHKRFLAILLPDAVGASYYAVKKDPFYELEMTTVSESDVTYKLFDTLAAACKFYRSVQSAEFLNLNDKIRKNANVAQLVGGAVFWIWNDCYDEVMYADVDTDRSPETGNELLRIADDLHENGVKKALFGIFFEKDSPLVEPLYTRYGYLSTQYDNYSDVLPPSLLDIVPHNRVKNCDYTFRRMKDWPDGVAVDEKGKLIPAWALKGFDGKMHDQNFLCPIVAAKRMKEEIPKILERFPYYRGRFIDVFGAGLSECHSLSHPLTLAECKKVKAEAFETVKNRGLITGTEDLMECVMNQIDYSEGIHSPVYWRIHNAGRNHAHVYDDAQKAHIKKHMLDPRCRVPLWQLAYHECLVAFPYWGDSTEMAPEYIREKILFACLYGAAPLFSFSVKDYEKLKPTILSAYKRITKVHEAVATLPMTDYSVLSDDGLLQQTVFGNRFTVTANFSDEERSWNGKRVSAKDFTFSDNGHESEKSV